MRIENYITLKGKSVISLSKETIVEEENERDAIYLNKKVWNPATGEALSDSKTEITLDYYESELAFVNNEITSCTNKKTALEKIIEDIKAL